MARKNNRYHIMEQYISLALIGDAVLFIAYLIVAAFGIVWAKVLLAVLALLLSAAIIGYLYLTKELLRPRSLWMTTAAAAVLVCTVFSLILNFPRPKYTLSEDSGSNPKTTVAETSGNITDSPNTTAGIDTTAESK